MADNTILNTGTGGDTIATDDIGGVKHQRVKIEFGADGVANDVHSLNPLPVVFSGELPAGTQNIGDVDIATMPPLPAGVNNIGDVDVLTMPPVTITSLPALPAGTNNIGDVDVLTMPPVTITSLPALPAGTNNIGDVDVLTLPADPLGANADAIVAAGAVGSISAKLRRVTQGLEDLKTTPLVAGTANIGDVDVLTLPPIPAGTNNIGDVDVLTLPAIPAGSNEIGRVRVTDGTNIASVASLASAKPLHVAVVDGAGNQIVSFGGGAGGGGTSAVDDAAFAPASGSGTPAMGMFDDVAPDSVDEGDAGVLRMSGKRELYTQIRDAAGNERGAQVNASNALLVAQTGALPAGTNNIGDVDVLTMPSVVISSLPTTPAGTNNIGDVDVLTVPADPFGTNADAIVAAGAVGSFSAKQRRMTQGLEDLKTQIVLAAGANNIGDVDVLTMPAVVVSSLPTTPAGTNNIGDVDVLTLPAIPTGSNVIGKVGLSPQTSGGLLASVTISAASTNATSVKGSAGQLYNVVVMNLNAAARYLKIYNKATAPTVGTDTPVQVFMIPGNTAGAGVVIEWTNGIEMTNGIAFALTTGIAHADTGAVAANEIVVNLAYK